MESFGAWDLNRVNCFLLWSAASLKRSRPLGHVSRHYMYMICFLACSVRNTDSGAKSSRIGVSDPGERFLQQWGYELSSSSLCGHNTNVNRQVHEPSVFCSCFTALMFLSKQFVRAQQTLLSPTLCDPDEDTLTVFACLRLFVVLISTTPGFTMIWVRPKHANEANCC